jgi:16S rRNA (cytosine1402-N4)-methyltransferase
MQHITVLQQEAVDGLLLSPDNIVVDATFGAGGHAKEIIQRLDARGTYIGIDTDSTAFSKKTFEHAKPTIHLVHDNFRNVSKILRSLQIEQPDAILADLGWRMEQFTDAKKGFSFTHDEPLLMTYGTPDLYPFTAETIVNEWEETSIADIIFGYGEERQSRKIAKAIVEARKKAPLQTTGDLVRCIETVLPRRYFHKVHPATKTFQALRIAVNDELGALKTFLADGYSALATQGRFAIITFHSLEDRIVKHYFKELQQTEGATVVTKKPIIATEEELKNNPRARSAKLRIIIKQ